MTMLDRILGDFPELVDVVNDMEPLCSTGVV